MTNEWATCQHFEEIDLSLKNDGIPKIDPPSRVMGEPLRKPHGAFLAPDGPFPELIFPIKEKQSDLLFEQEFGSQHL